MAKRKRHYRCQGCRKECQSWSGFCIACRQPHQLQARFWSKVQKSPGCWLWAGNRDQYGYGRFWKDGRKVKAHRMSAELAGMTIPHGMVVCHRCDNPPCVNPAHLFAGTPDENSADMKAKGRSSRGKPYLAPGVADRVISMLKAGYPQRAVMRETGVCARAVSRYSVQVKRAVQISPEAEGKKS